MKKYEEYTYTIPIKIDDLNIDEIKNYLLKKVYYTIDINFIYESNLNEISINPHISSFHRSSNWICSNSN